MLYPHINERGFSHGRDRYPNAVIEAAGCMPLLIPAVGPQIDCGAVLDRLDGLLDDRQPLQCRADAITAARRAMRERCTIPTATPRHCR